MERLTNNNGYLIKCKNCLEKSNCYSDICCNHIFNSLKKLAEYEDLEEQGLLKKFPCMVGDYIWDNVFGKPCCYEVTGFSFGNLNQDDWEDENVFDQVVVYYTNSNGSITGNFAVSEIGRTVFLTQAEAEEALKRRESEE